MLEAMRHGLLVMPKARSYLGCATMLQPRPGRCACRQTDPVHLILHLRAYIGHNRLQFVCAIWMQEFISQGDSPRIYCSRGIELVANPCDIILGSIASCDDGNVAIGE